MSLISDLIRAGVDPDLVERVSDALADARAQGARESVPLRTARQDRNARYYQAKKERQADTSENVLIQTPKTDFPSPVSPKVSPQEIYNQPPILPPSGESSGRDAPKSELVVFGVEFSEFYNGYPKHENRKDAEKRYSAARKSGVAHVRIMDGLGRWRAKWDADRTERQFIPAPDVWLNKAKYDDKPEPNARAGPSPADNVVNPFPSRGQTNVREAKSASAAAAAIRQRLFGDESQSRDAELRTGEGSGLRDFAPRLLSQG